MCVFVFFLPSLHPWDPLARANYSINGISRKRINTGKNTGKNPVSDKRVSVPKVYCPIGYL